MADGQQVEIDVVGSSNFARYPKIDFSQTWNMFISDNWMVNYGGYKDVLDININERGRGIFYSIRGNYLLAVIGNRVYKIDSTFTVTPVGTVDPSTADVFMDENLSQQICIVDNGKCYIYSDVTNAVTAQTLTIPAIAPIPGYDLVPGYVCYHNTFFLLSSSRNSQYPFTWYAFEYDTDNTIKFVTDSQFLLQTKPDKAIAVRRLPGRGNNVLVLGETVAEMWTQVGGIENYRRVSSFNIDSGLVSPSTLAASEEYLCYLAQNENNAPFIVVTNGNQVQRISTDGIDYRLSKIVDPNDANAFFYRQDGHLFYQLTFNNPADNLTLVYDFNTQKFFQASDENLNYHPASHMVFFQGKSYFISHNQGSLFLMDSDLVTANYSTNPSAVGEEIPRIRICSSFRKPNSGRFRVKQFTFWLEQGMPNKNSAIQPRIDFSFSKDGNQSFSSVVSKELNPVGKFRNQIRFWRMGQANEFTIQLRYYGFTRFIANNGMLEIE